MSENMKPGSNSGKQSGIYQEVGPRGGLKDNFVTIPENRTLPPTSQSGNSWIHIDKTPHGTHKY